MEKRKDQIFYYDVIRAVACLSVIIIHFNASFSAWSGGVFTYPNAVFPNFIFNQSVYLGDLGVSLFFILSGAAMFRTYGGREISLGAFYRKRFLSLYPMFWLAWFAAASISLLYYRGMAAGDMGAALSTLLGTDGYMMALGYSSLSVFYQVGEWYLGCIVLIYLLMPILLWGVKKYPAATTAASFLIFLILYKRVPDVFFLIRIPEVVFGMLFDRYFRSKDGISQGIWVAGVVLGIVVLSEMGQSFVSTGCGLVLCMFISALVFILVALISRNMQLFGQLGAKLAGYTYPAFLVHHQICEYMSKRFYLPEIPKNTLFFAFLVYIVIVGVMSIILTWTSQVVLNWFRAFLSPGEDAC